MTLEVKPIHLGTAVDNPTQDAEGRITNTEYNAGSKIGLLGPSIVGRIAGTQGDAAELPLLFKPSERINVTTAVAAIDINVPSGAKYVRIKGIWRNAGASGALVYRRNHGAGFLVGTTDYYYTSHYSIGTTHAVQGTTGNTFGLLTLGLSLTTIFCNFEADFFVGDGTYQGTYGCLSYGYQGEAFSGLLMGYNSTTTPLAAMTQIRLLTNNATNIAEMYAGVEYI